MTNISHHFRPNSTLRNLKICELEWRHESLHVLERQLFRYHGLGPPESNPTEELGHALDLVSAAEYGAVTEHTLPGRPRAIIARIERIHAQEVAQATQIAEPAVA